MTERTAADRGLDRAAVIARAADRLITAARTGVPAAPVRDLIGSTDVALAYGVQRALTQARLASGARTSPSPTPSRTTPQAGSTSLATGRSGSSSSLRPR
jgi:hypothetical protein